MKINFLKFFDKHVASKLARILPRPKVKTSHHLNRVLIVRPGGIGDAVLLLPMLRSISEATPKVEIDVLAEKRNAGIFTLCPGIRKIYCYDTVAGLIDVFARRYDVIIDSEQWHYLSAIVVRFIRSDRKVGFSTNARSRLFTDPVAYSDEKYEAECFLKLLQPLNIEGQAEAPFVEVPGPEIAEIKVRLSAMTSRRFLSIFPGASIPERQWGEERFSTLVDRFAAQGWTVVVVGGPQDASTGEALAAVGRNVMNLAGQCSLAETAAVIKASSLLISADSGVLHIGVGLGTPTVSLFGPGISRKWAPRDEMHRVVNKELACSPCTRFGYTPKCPIGVKCMQDITVDAVYIASMELLMSVEKHD